MLQLTGPRWTVLLFSTVETTIRTGPPAVKGTAGSVSAAALQLSTRSVGRTKEVQTLDDAIVLLNSRGLLAQRRQWSLGDTVVVTHAIGEVVREIEVFPLALYIVSSDGRWEVVDCMRSGPYDVTPCQSLDEACDVVTSRLTAPPLE